MADEKMVKLFYQPPKGEIWEREFPEKQAAKMVKMGRWKKERPKGPESIKPEGKK